MIVLHTGCFMHHNYDTGGKLTATTIANVTIP